MAQKMIVRYFKIRKSGKVDRLMRTKVFDSPVEASDWIKENRETIELKGLPELEGDPE